MKPSTLLWTAFIFVSLCVNQVHAGIVTCTATCIRTTDDSDITVWREDTGSRCTQLKGRCEWGCTDECGRSSQSGNLCRGVCLVKIVSETTVTDPETPAVPAPVPPTLSPLSPPVAVPIMR